MSRAFWDPGAGLYGMFDVWHFTGCDSVVSSGLGGGSLIYANVLLRKDEHWFVQDDPLPHGGYESWPVTRADLDPHYDEVERMLGATPYPLGVPPYAETPKTHAMQDAAAELGLPWQLPPLAVSFAPAPGAAPGPGLPIVDPDYGNLHGRPRTTCRLCGECDIGCNIGAKNSLDYNYLSAAQHHGADLRTGHEVRAIRPRPAGGYEVDYIRHPPAEQSGAPGPGAASPRTIVCERLVLAAGTYGTSYLLLRNRPSFPGLSAALGTRFSGNGDVLNFLLHARDRSRTRPLDASRGPVITSAIRLSDQHDPAGTGRGAYLEDGGYPAFVDWLVEAADMAGDTRRLAQFVLQRCHAMVARTPNPSVSREISELIGTDSLSVSSLPLLGMGRDVPDGVLRLRAGRLDLTWTTASSEAYFDRVLATMRRIAAVLGARCVNNPLWLSKRIITAHPVGGAPMGRDPSVGVCDPYGEVFGYPGLYIADGAAMPGPVGPNPSLTIAALADRMCTRLLEKPPATTAGGADLVRAGSAAADPADSAPRCGRERTSLSFTEEMSGTCFPGASNGGPGAARLPQEPLAFRLTITADDLERFLDEPEHSARAEGWIDAASIGGRRQIQRGWFNLFAPDGEPDRRLMWYRLQFEGAVGQPRTLIGWKNVWHGALTRIWPDTSTLYFRLLAGYVAPEGDDQARILAAGTLHLHITDFVRQLTTIRVAGPHCATGLERFGRFFAGQLWDVYGPDRHHAGRPPIARP
jgi:cholesterol oxidase